LKLNDFKLERYFAKYEFSAPYLLCASDCETMSLKELMDIESGTEEKFSEIRMGYTDSLGSTELREAIAGLYTHISVDQILVHSGAEEAIFNFMNVFLKSGDHVILHAPYYQSLGEVARGIGARITEWRGDPTKNWELDLDILKESLSSNTKLVIVNFPHNPTGFLPKQEFFKELSDLSDNHGFMIFSDEVYRGLELNPEDRLPVMAGINENAVSLGVMSKTYGLAGLRIGWISTRNKSIYNKMAAFKDYTTICNSAPSEYLAALALRHADLIAGRNLQIIRSNLNLLDWALGSHTELIEWYRPAAGSIAFPGFLKGPVDEFCNDLRKKTGILLLPGTVYGKDYNAFRLGYGRKNLPEAIEKLGEYIKFNYNQ